MLGPMVSKPCNLLLIRIQGTVGLCALGKAASLDTSVVVGPLPVPDFVPGLTQKIGEFMLSGLSGENKMSSLNLRDLSIREQSENIYNPMLRVKETVALALEHFGKCTTIATRYCVGTEEKIAF